MSIIFQIPAFLVKAGMTEEEREAIKEFINKTTEEQDMTASEIDHAVACFIDGWVAHERRSVK